MKKTATLFIALALVAGASATGPSKVVHKKKRQTAATQNQTSGTSQVPKVDSAEDRQRIQAAQARRQKDNANGDPDVLLDVPNLSVDKIELEVDNVQARLALDARVLNLLQLSAGVDAGIGKVKLTIQGVRAQALLKVRLDNVREIIDRVMTTLDRNPQAVDRLLQTVDNTVGTVGNLGGQALNTLGPVLNNVTAPNGLLSQTVNTLGQTVQRTIDATGNIVEKTLDTTGKVVGSQTVGSVLNLPVVSQSVNAAGQTVKTVRDTGGRLIELVLDQAGKLVSSRVLANGGSGQGNSGQGG